MCRKDDLTPLPAAAPIRRAPQKKSTPPPQTFGVFLTILCNPRAYAKGKQIYQGRKRERYNCTLCSLLQMIAG